MKRIAAISTLVTLSFAVVAQGPGPGPRGPAAADGTAPGWSMMTPQEREAHQAKMRGLKDPAQCESYMREHHDLMEKRAKQKGQSLPWNGPRPYCEYLKKPA